MARVYLKKSTKTASTGSDDVRATVMGILNDIEAGATPPRLTMRRNLTAMMEI